MPKGWSPQSTTTCSCSPTTARTSMAGWRLTIVASATFGSTSSSSPSRIEPLGYRSTTILESVFSEPRLFIGKLLRRHPRQRANERREHLQLLLGDVVGWPHSVLKASMNSHHPHGRAHAQRRAREHQPSAGRGRSDAAVRYRRRESPLGSTRNLSGIKSYARVAMQRSLAAMNVANIGM